MSAFGKAIATLDDADGREAERLNGPKAERLILGAENYSGHSLVGLFFWSCQGLPAFSSTAKVYEGRLGVQRAF
jgi:hypothetical protein